jgi:hypothetical protein
VFSVWDESLSRGTVGLYSWGNRQSLFDDLLVLRPGDVGLRKLVGRVYGRAEPLQRMVYNQITTTRELTVEENDAFSLAPHVEKGANGLYISVWVVGACVFALVVAMLCLRRRGMLAAHTSPHKHGDGDKLREEDGEDSLQILEELSFGPDFEVTDETAVRGEGQDTLQEIRIVEETVDLGDSEDDEEVVLVPL